MMQFKLGFRNGFGVDLELTPKDVGVAHIVEEEDSVLITIQSMVLRLPLLSFELLFIDILEEEDEYV